MTMNAWLRLGTHLQSFKNPKKLDKLTQDGELDLLINAEIIDMVGLTGNLVGEFGPGPMGDSINGSVSVLDLIARFDFDDAFHFWAGRMLVPSDRTNFSGPWFIAPWFYPGVFVRLAPPVGPKQGPNGRNDGATVWGQVAGGTFKYYAGIYDLYSKTEAPLFSGRLSLSLINPEPGFYGNSQFYGTKDVLGIGIGVQAKKDGSGAGRRADDYFEFNADILFEKNLGSAGVLDLEAAFYKYEGDFEPIDYSYFALASYLLPMKVGPGQLQPLVRLQQAKPADEDADTWTLVDAQLGYVVSEFACRFALGYQYQDVLGQKGNQLFFGIQLQK
jgi:hypothetical protein